MWRWVGLALFVLAAGCHSAEPLNLDPPPDSARSMLLALPDARQGWGDALEGAPLPALAELGDGPLVVLYYPVPLEALGFTAGLVPLVPEGEGRGAPPTNLGAVYLPASGARLSLTEGADVVARIRLAALGDAECRALSGCYPATPELEQVCQPSCTPTAVEPPAEVTPPAFPRLGGCTAEATATLGQWSAAVADCVPAALPECGPGTFAAGLATACTPLAICTHDGWPAAVSAGARFVDPAAAAGGDGSRAQPFQTLAAALQPGATEVALRGEVAAPATPLIGVRLVGACPTAASVRGDLSLGAGARVAGLEVAGALALAGPGTAAEGVQAGTASVTASGVTLTSVRVLGAAAVLPGTAVTVDGLHVGGGMSVRGSLSGQRVTVAPSGLDVFAGGQADLQEATLQGGLRISGGGRAHLRAAVIREGGIGLDGATLEASDVWVHDAPGDGATVSGAALRLERAVIERSAVFGVQLVGSTTSTLTDVRVADTGDHAVWVSGGVHLLGERLALTDAGGEGLRSEVDPEGAPEPKLDLSDVLVRGVQEESCLAFLRTTKATLRRARLEQCGIIGLRTDRRGTEVDASDIVVAGASLGLRFEGGSATTLTRALVASSRAAGLCVDDPGTALVARHVRVQDTLRVANDSCIDLVAGAGLGMAVHSGAQIDLEAFEVENSAALGVELGSPSMNSFRDGVIRDGPVGVHSVNVWREPDLMRGIRYEGNGLDLDVLME